MKHNFEENKNQRINKANAKAAKLKQQSASLQTQADQLLSAIPPGQPILIGHHSEKKDRNYRDKIHNKFRQANEAWKKAVYYDQVALAAAQNTAISSDDPQAIEKLQQRIADLQSWQQFMKQANQCIRKKDKDTFLQCPNTSPALWELLNTTDCMGDKGYPPYKLSNNNQNIKRLEARLQSLQKVLPVEKEKTVNGITIVLNEEANRVQLVFPAKPAENVRHALKKHGFRFSYTESAWQRHLNTAGMQAADYFCNTVYPSLSNQ